MEHRNSNTNLALAQEETQRRPAQKSSQSKTALYSNKNPRPYPFHALNNGNNSLVDTPKIDEELNFGSLGKIPQDPDTKVEHINLMRHRSIMMGLSPKHHKRLTGCGSLYLEFKSEKKASYYLQTNCHSDFCPVCAKTDLRKGMRVVKVIGSELIKYCAWYHVVTTIPERFQLTHFLDMDNIDKFLTDSYEIIIEELGLWNDLERFDRSGAILAPHYYGDRESRYNFHVDMMIPAIRYGKPIDNPVMKKPEFEKFRSKVRRRMAMRLSNIVNEKLDAQEMNFHLKVKTDPTQVAHDIKYMVRNTVKSGKDDNLFQYFHEGSDETKDFLANGRENKMSVRYKGKMAGGELKGLYKYIGLDYEKRNESYVGEWIDCDGKKIEFVSLRTKNDLQGVELKKIGNGSYTYNDQKSIDEKFSDKLFRIVDIANEKFLKKQLKEWEELLEGMKVNWSISTIRKCLEKNILVIENTEITTEECLILVKKEKAKLKTERTRIENQKIVEELYMETVLSGCSYEYFLNNYGKYKLGSPSNSTSGKSKEQWAEKEYEKYYLKYKELEVIGIKHTKETRDLFNKWIRCKSLHSSRTPYDPGCRESIAEDQKIWDQLRVDVGKFLRKHGWVKAKREQKQRVA